MKISAIRSTFATQNSPKCSHGQDSAARPRGLLVSASDSVLFLRHCVSCKFTYVLTYLIQTASQLGGHPSHSPPLLDSFGVSISRVFGASTVGASRRWPGTHYEMSAPVVTAFPLGELEETTRTPPYYVDEDYPAGPGITEPLPE